MKLAVARVLATVAGLGDRLPAPGTLVGSPAGVLLFLLALKLVPGSPVMVSVLGVLFLVPLAVWACGAEAARRAAEDPGAIVLDETAGQWLALGLLVVVRRRPPQPGEIAAAFALFRLLDVLKPWPIRALERLPGGWGIVADDLAAGLLAGLLLLVASELVPGLE